MNIRTQSNGTPPPRGVQGRPDIRAQETFGAARVTEILQHRKSEVLALFANDPRPEAMFDRMIGLAVGAYKKAQDDENDSASKNNKSPRRIDEVSAVACCIWSMQRKLDPGIDVYFVPYGGRLTPIMSPDGVIKLLFRTGMVKAINAKYVFNGAANPKDGEELFDYMLGSTQWVKHKKNNVRPEARKQDGQLCENPQEWNLLSHAYAIIDLKDGGQVIEVLDKADIAYFRDLSPTGASKYGGWAKFPAAFGRKAALKQAAKFAPKDSEVSIILTADDTDRGIEIPDDIMKAVGARMLADMTGEAPPNGQIAEPPPNTQQTQQAPAQNGPPPGNPEQILIPGKGTQPTIVQATDAQLAEAEGRMRATFNAGKWPDEWRDRNITQLATIRAEMRWRKMPVEPHAFFDGTQQQEPVYEYGTNEREPGQDG